MADNEATVTTQATENTAQNTATEAAANKATEASQENKGTDIERLINQAVDRATNKLGNENKKLRTEIDNLKKANMDADELKKFELSEKEKEIADREKALADRENRLFAIKAIKEAGLDDGSDASLAIVDFVMAENEDGIKERVKAFDALVKRIVQTKVDGVFKANGRTPGVGNESTEAGAKNNTDSIAVRLGKNAAQVNQQSRSVLDHYMGGK